MLVHYAATITILLLYFKLLLIIVVMSCIKDKNSVRNIRTEAEERTPIRTTNTTSIEV